MFNEKYFLNKNLAIYKNQSHFHLDYSIFDTAKWSSIGMKLVESRFNSHQSDDLQLIIFIKDAISIIIRIYTVDKTVTVIIFITIKDAITVIVVIKRVDQTISIIVLLIIRNAITIIIIIFIV